MKNNLLVSLTYLTFFISITYSQNQAIMSYESKYANGSGSSIDYFENILDVKVMRTVVGGREVYTKYKTGE